MADESAERHDPNGYMAYAGDYHAPVLWKTVVERLVTNPDGLYVDGTLGGGGHTSALLDALSSNGRVVALDRDDEAINWSRKRLANAIDANRFIPLRSNFVEVESALESIGVRIVDGLLLDLGVSSHQVDAADRGFSFRFSADLDMRMDRRAERSARDLLNEIDENDLKHLLFRYGEEPRAAQIARAVVRSRPLRTTDDLALAVRSAVPNRVEKKSLARVFQAIRIDVNAELKALLLVLEAATRIVRPGGRLVVISYHSLEDRLVKHFLRSGNADDVLRRDTYGNVLSEWKPVGRKAIKASPQEIALNPRARSARMRTGERTSYRSTT
ncbi:MAG: 16S rRNA (cytosine(1402)-N(4))-methyltransferase RsmH [Rhodothermales bacterium]|nr:16S rRNA (cytosine(1402)-N(4))-methyltransferase RsmH [Rhodothermales bacterium]